MNSGHSLRLSSVGDGTTYIDQASSFADMTNTSWTPQFDGSMAQEAALLSHATSQAMIAARSILLSGGTQSTAMSTAKAAAQSILVPHPSDMEGPAAGKRILGRRKAKRQADIIASMALVSVNNSLTANPVVLAPGLQQNQHFPQQEQQYSQQGDSGTFHSQQDLRTMYGAPGAASPRQQIPPTVSNNKNPRTDTGAAAHPKSPRGTELTFSTVPTAAEVYEAQQRAAQAAARPAKRKGWVKKKKRLSSSDQEQKKPIDPCKTIVRHLLPNHRQFGGQLVLNHAAMGSPKRNFASQMPLEDPIYNASAVAAAQMHMLSDFSVSESGSSDGSDEASDSASGSFYSDGMSSIMDHEGRGMIQSGDPNTASSTSDLYWRRFTSAFLCSPSLTNAEGLTEPAVHTASYGNVTVKEVVVPAAAVLEQPKARAVSKSAPTTSKPSAEEPEPEQVERLPRSFLCGGDFNTVSTRDDDVNHGAGRKHSFMDEERDQESQADDLKGMVVNQSVSSVDSDELLRRLNWSSSDENGSLVTTRLISTLSQESIDSLVLQALTAKMDASKPFKETRDQKAAIIKEHLKKSRGGIIKEKEDRITRARRKTDPMSGVQPNHPSPRNRLATNQPHTDTKKTPRFSSWTRQKRKQKHGNSSNGNKNYGKTSGVE